ncbi:ICMT-domain-containing protein [Thozetella sp. PMI_491]|nr:ICMT-domain-containing protein [Thozetella sp. PMI_491]
MDYTSDSSGDSELDIPAAAGDQTYSDDRLYLPGRPKSIAGIAMRAFCLGIALASSLIALVLVRSRHPSSPHWRLAFYGVTLSTFHFLEFWTTAICNTRDATTKSFVPTENIPVYIMAHAFAFLECLVYRVLYWHSGFKPFPGPPISVVLGLPLVIGGQLIRTLAIIHAGAAISRSKQSRRRGGRALVTGGVYSVLRHPSYIGFFWWAIGTQMVLGNTISFFAFVVALWSFFAGRVRREEEYLRHSFGKPYLDYRERVRTMMPFIG